MHVLSAGKKRKESRQINVPISDNLHSTTIAQLSVYIKLRLRKIASSVYKKLRLGKTARILLKQLRKTRKFRNRFDFEKSTKNQLVNRILTKSQQTPRELCVQKVIVWCCELQSVKRPHLQCVQVGSTMKRVIGEWSYHLKNCPPT